tara:strand:+ start:207 stop:377 length:171 start_codon:yes stop_codon:yes gene_type:complete
MKEEILPILMKYFKVYRGKEQNYENIFECCDELVEKLQKQKTFIESKGIPSPEDIG